MSENTDLLSRVANDTCQVEVGAEWVERLCDTGGKSAFYNHMGGIHEDGACTKAAEHVKSIGLSSIGKR